MVRSQFSELFAQSADIFAAIKTVLARGKVKEIDPVEVVREYLSIHPDTPLSDAELLEKVVQAAADAGVAIKVNSPPADHN
jgi:histidinol phosphatase-like PHP family hydrolase